MFIIRSHRTTELEAINTMLSVIGATPINSLTEAKSVDVVMAQNILREVSTDVQSKGWFFNKEFDFVLIPDEKTREVILPDNIVYVNVKNKDYICRGNRVYDTKKHTFKFEEDRILADIVQILDFEYISEQARRYITIRAARIFQSRVLGSDTLHKFSQEEEYKALAALRREDDMIKEHTMLGHRVSMFGNWRPAKVLER